MPTRPRKPQPNAGNVGLDSETAASLRKEMVRCLARHTSDATLADDLAQEAFVHLLRGLPRYRGAAAVTTWARRIALNVWRDYLRRTAARPEGHVEVSVFALLDSLGPPVHSDRVEAAHDQHVTHECLLEATRQVPPGPRRVLLLHDFGDMPLAQVAAALGCSTATARVRLHRARRRLSEVCRAECACEPATDGTPVCEPKRPKRSSKARGAKPARARRT
jgi:RNA polymerase sigma-70 factor, ECF subfamily